MITTDKAQNLKKDLFEVIQYCHDNDNEFFKRFCSMNIKRLESINSIFMSGSSAIMFITYWYHDDLFDKTIPIKTQDLLEWVVEHQLTTSNKGN